MSIYLFLTEFKRMVLVDNYTPYSKKNFVKKNNFQENVIFFNKTKNEISLLIFFLEKETICRFLNLPLNAYLWSIQKSSV